MEINFSFPQGHQFDQVRLAEIVMNLSVLAHRMKELLSVSQVFNADGTVSLTILMGEKTSKLPHVISNFVGAMGGMGGENN